MAPIRRLQPASQDVVNIAGVTMPVLAGDENRIPDIDPHFYFAQHAGHIAGDILKAKNVLLTGHMGTGKTSVVEQIAARMGQAVMRVNMNGQTTIADFVGMWTVKGGETVWVDGALPTAMREGMWLILDELDFAEAPILSVLNPVLEPNGRLFLKEKGPEVIKPHANFRVFGTANTVGVMEDFRSLYQGTNTLNAAFLDRWRVYHVDYLPKLQEIAVLMGKFGPDMTKEMASDIVRVATQAREQFERQELREPFSLRRLLDWTESMLDHGCPIEGAKSTIFAKVSSQDRQVLEGLIGRVLLSHEQAPVASSSMGRSLAATGATPAAAKISKPKVAR